MNLNQRMIMKNINLIIILFISLSCSSLKNQNNAESVNEKANQQLFALKGYQPIDPISIDDSKIRYDSLIYYFPNEATRIAIGKMTQTGSLSFGTNTVALKGESYTIIIDYIKYHTTNIPERYTYEEAYTQKATVVDESFETLFGEIRNQKELKSSTVKQDSSISQNRNKQEVKIPVYVGVGLRIQANISVLKDSLNVNLGSLYNLGIAASNNEINGTLIIQTLGISGQQISSAIPIPDKISESTIQNAITSLATIKSKLYDKETYIKSQVVGFGLSFNIDGAKDLIEATLHSRPPTILERQNKGLIFQETSFGDQ